MTHTPANPLRPLEPAVRPIGAPGPSSSPAGPVESAGFQQLLRDAARLPIELSPAARQQLTATGRTLNDDDLSAIRQAIDQAQQAGARRALILTDRFALIADASTRTVERALSPDDRHAAVTGIDAAVWAEPDPESSRPHRIRL